jgi:Na+/proline symporter
MYASVGLMNWNIAISALIAASILSIVAGYFGGRQFAKDDYFGPLRDFALANQTLGRRNVMQLLLSTSFSLNGMLYQIWLGYSIGLWALVVQGVWALSYYWLGKHVNQVRSAPSLHAFLGHNFGQQTRTIAALCSIVGFAIIVGWEFSVARATFGGLLNQTGQVPQSLLLLFIFAVVLVCVLYTSIGGLGGDVFANTLQNAVKAAVFVIMITLLFNSEGIVGRLFPPFSRVVAELGIFGLITNLAFSAVWQFVDMSTWQSVIASKNRLADDDARLSLRDSGIAVFIAPGFIGTLLGALVVSQQTIDSDNIMIKLVGNLPTADNPVLVFAIFFALIVTVMSMVDGVLLAAAYSTICDILYRNTSIESLDASPAAGRILGLFRLTILIIAITGVFAVTSLVDAGISLFNVTYVLIITQLALAGPIFVALVTKRRADDRMMFAIIAGLVVGFTSFGSGATFGIGWLVTGAGFFTIIASCVTAGAFARASR